MELEIEYKGLSTSPDDYRCADGELAEVSGMRNDDGSWKMSLPSLTVGRLAEGVEIVYVHETQDGYKNYIVKDADSLSWRQSVSGITEAVLTQRTVTSVTAVGNMLCIATEEGLVYAVWRGGKYVVMESPLWRPKVQFCLDGEWRMKEDEGIVWAKRLLPERGGGVTVEGTLLAVKAGIIAASNPQTITISAVGLDIDSGHVWGFSIEGVGDKSEADKVDADYTFTVGYLDGSAEEYKRPVSGQGYTSVLITAKKEINNISGKVTITRGSTTRVNVVVKLLDYGSGGMFRLDSDGVASVKARVNNYEQEAKEDHVFLHPFFAQVGARMYDGNVVAVGPPCQLVPDTSMSPYVIALNDITGISRADDYYSKTVDGIVYRGFKTVTGAMRCTLRFRALNTDSVDDGLFQSIVIAVSEPVQMVDVDDTKGYKLNSLSRDNVGTSMIRGGSVSLYSSVNSVNDKIVERPMRTNTEDALLQASAAMYIVQEIPVAELPKTSIWTDVDMTEVDMSALSAREKMPVDSSYLETYCGGDAYAYNSRLHVGGYRERLFEGYGVNEMSGVTGVVLKQTNASVEVTEDGEACAVAQSDYILGSAMTWYFYPRIGASRAVVTSGDKTYEVALKKHPYRSGSYWFDGFAAMTENASAVAAENNTVPKKNYLRVSEVNNPLLMSNAGTFSFRSEVVRIASAVTALSTGQMGQFDLYVLTRGDGVWSLKMSDEGKYLRQVPVSRDAVLGDGESLCQVDGSIVFATARGVMELQGSRSACMSDGIVEAMQTATTEAEGAGMATVKLSTYLTGCRIVYDYVGQRLIVGNSKYDYVYVRSLKTGLWSAEAMTLMSVLNSYPDAMIVTKGDGGVGEVKALSQTDGIEGMTGTGHLVTRVLKLGDSNRYKRVTHVRQNGLYDGSKMQQRLYASNDMRNWVLVASAQGGRMTVAGGGTAYRFWRVAVDVQLADGEYLSSMTVGYALVDNDKLM